MRHSLLEWHEITDIRVESPLHSPPIMPSLVLEIAVADQSVDFSREQFDREALHTLLTTLSIYPLAQRGCRRRRAGHYHRSPRRSAPDVRRPAYATTSSGREVRPL